MNKLFIGLLILAAGTGVYFFLHQQNKKDNLSFDKVSILGQWKLDSITRISTGYDKGMLSLFSDSSLKNLQYEFRKDSSFIVRGIDSTETEQSYYEWTLQNKLLMKDKLTDTTGELFTINKLQSDSLTLQAGDNTIFFFVKK